MENSPIVETSEDDEIIPPTIQSGSPNEVIINGESATGTNLISPEILVSPDNLNSQLDLSMDLFHS